MTKLAEWLQQATEEEAQMLAIHAGTTVGYLTNLARNYDGRKPNVVMALAIEQGTKDMRAVNRKLPVVTVIDLAQACGGK